MGKSNLSEILQKWKSNYRDFYEIDFILSLFQPNHPWLQYRYLLTESQKVRDQVKNCHTTQRKLYPCSSFQFFFIVFWKGKNCSLIKIYRMNQSILKKISNQIPHNDFEELESWKPAEDIKLTLKGLTHQLKRKIWLCKKDLEKHLEKKEKVDLSWGHWVLVGIVKRACGNSKDQLK